MWGYIVSQPTICKWLKVPSLYVRVYRPGNCFCSQFICSLIICEGISKIYQRKRICRAFPHYMWGYIEPPRRQCVSVCVPSLYVRVYHRDFLMSKTARCSLIICEGISVIFNLFQIPFKFPHYMWGYIIAGAILGCRELVPSLYVRVYRFKPGDTRINYGSLIICEGISEHVQEAAEMLPFPHYMWGYILKIICYNYHVFVPSLYVRVYRTLEECEKFVERSLIICEGISGFLYCNYRPTKFPHYMWGYIASETRRQNRRGVPSLYVRVYPFFWIIPHF